MDNIEKKESVSRKRKGVKGKTKMTFTDILKAIIAPAVVAAIVSLAGIIINNKIENKNNINTYRYTELHLLLKNWDNYSNKSDKVQGRKIVDNLKETKMNDFLDCMNRYDFAKPLLDDKFTKELDKFFEEGYNLLFQIYLNRTEREELVESMIEFKEKPQNFDEEKFYEKINAKLRPMQNKNYEEDFVFGIDIECDELVKQFTIFSGNTSCLKKAITQQLKELVK